MRDIKIDSVELGRGGAKVGMQGLGCMSLGAGPEADTVAQRATLEAALAGGVTLFDTADVYGSGASEEFLSSFVRDHRDEIVLATKFGRVRRTAEDGGRRPVRNDRAYIRQAVEASLRRLGTDVIDLYYMHRRDGRTPLSESVGAMAELVDEGKVRRLGLCEVSGAELHEAHAIHPISAVQSEWSLFARDVEDSLVAAAAGLGVAVVPYSPLGRGFLAGMFTDATAELDSSDYRRHHSRLTGENARANATLLEPVRAVAAAHEATLGQVALAWVQQRAEVHGLISVVPIPGTRKAGRVAENLRATRLTLSEAELAELEPLAARVVGDRFTGMSRPPAARG
ncbi:aldo/keto reductase [Streptomyces sp. NPDC056161]|uniref:aldo/keto reductase n=1 Tax=Streptomyces sp. NPDC056161 TaxID=3345732 RepID=UPI0035D90456